MGKRIFRTYKRRVAARLRRIPWLPVALMTVLAISFTVMQQENYSSIVPDSYRPLLDIIATAESHGNYNAYYGSTNNSSIDFTHMSIQEVIEWQKEHIAAGNVSSAVGRYQIIDTTLAGLVRDMDLDTSQAFNEATQDAMAIALLEQRGSVRYVNNALSRSDFAANIAKEWASLPKMTGDDPGHSYYAGDGLNASLIDTETVLHAIDALEPER